MKRYEVFFQRLIIFEFGLAVITFDTYFPHMLNNLNYYLIVVITNQCFKLFWAYLDCIPCYSSAFRAFQLNRKPTEVLVKVINQDIKRTNSISSYVGFDAFF